MTKVIYLLGAGASYGMRNSNQSTKLIYITKVAQNGYKSTYTTSVPDISEGLPIVQELPGRMKYVESKIRETISTNHNDNNQALFLADAIEWAAKECSRHATIDTFAKKLYITGQLKDYNKLKHTISAYFMFEQIYGKVDKRYDAFFASILGESSTSLPKNISILSWNYDTQLELAYQEYLNTSSFRDLQVSLSMSSKNTKNEDSSTGFNITKLNGSALLYNTTAQEYFDIFLQHKPKDIREFCKIVSDEKQNLTNALSFAWEKYDNEFIKGLEQKIKDTEVLVVIGYSFPYFNREIDKTILKSMSNLRKIYIQDSYPDKIEQSLKPLLSAEHNKINKTEITKLYDTNQFYLPIEL